jgi:phenylpyruvate tautomerase PptA (4-oxalocrotonate tautomerase family)
MVQVKIYGLKMPLMAHADLLSAAIHNAIVKALVYSPEKKFHRLIGLEKSEFIYPADRSENYTIIEISMFEGRSTEAKKSLIRLIFANIEREVGIKPQDVEITIYETPNHHWGIRGLCGDELALGYKVDV